MAAGFYIYETKPLTLRFKPDGVLVNSKKIIVTILQGISGTMIEKTGTDLAVNLTDNTVTVHLSQEETARFTPGTAQVQANILYEDEERDTSVQAQIGVFDNLHREIMA